jgi:hypothetical protein
MFMLSEGIDDENKQFMDDVASKVIDEQKGLEIKKKLSYRARIKMLMAKQ